MRCFVYKRSLQWRTIVSVLTLGAIVVSVSGCAAFRSYRAEMDETLDYAQSGDLKSAIANVVRDGGKDTKNLLFQMELGELQRLNRDFRASQAAFQFADAQVQAWESAAKLNLSRGAGAISSYIVNDKLRVYEGQDFEKVMITTRLAMNLLALGDWNNARVEIKRTHEREALIAELRNREYAKVEEDARARGIKTSFRELNGYPVETIDTKEVRELKNAYQNALSHYLAGFVYEALGEISLAAPGYRKAIELRPGQSLLDDSLAGLDDRVAQPDDNVSDVLIVIESGATPGRVSRQFNLPVPVGAYGEWIFFPVSFPVMPPSSPYSAPTIKIDGEPGLRTAHILDLDSMARRALRDEMPGLVTRAVIRATTKAVAQYQMQRSIRESRRSNNGQNNNLGLELLGLFAIQVASIITESADERGWRTLPSHVSLARVRLPKGQHSIEVAAGGGSAKFDVNVAGRHALVAVRMLGSRGFVMPAAAPPTVPLPADAKTAAADNEFGTAVSVLNFGKPLDWEKVR